MRLQRVRHDRATNTFTFIPKISSIEESNRMGNTRDLFKKIRDTKGTFHAKMGIIKEGMDLKETEDIKSGKNTQKNYTKQIFMTQITMMV